MGKHIQKISEDGLKTLMEYHWPGNVRELENVIERAMVVCKENIIGPEDLHLIKRVPSGESPGYNKTIRAVEREHILKILKENHWNIQRSAEVLDIDRVTLYNKIKKYGLKEE